MKIEKLSLYNFRIYKGKKEFDFQNKKLIVFLGANGSGKSAIYDAIEWLITGNISRYEASKENNFNFIVNNGIYNSGNYKTYVEIKFDDGNVIRRSIERKSGDNTREVKKVTINGQVVNWQKGSEQIYINITGDKSLEGVERFIKTFKPSTILSQDEISKFVLSDNPDSRLKLFMDILSLKSYGDDFKKDITNNRKILNENMEEVKNKINQLNLKREELLGELKQKETELKYEINSIDSKNVFSNEELLNNINSFLEENENLIGKNIKFNDINKDNIAILVQIIDGLSKKAMQLDKEIDNAKYYMDKEEHLNKLLSDEKELIKLNLQIENNKSKVSLNKNELADYKLKVCKINEKIKTYKLESGKEKENIEAENELRNQLRELTIRLNNNGFNSIKDFEREKRALELKIKELTGILECKQLEEVNNEDNLLYKEKEHLFNNNSKQIESTLFKLKEVEDNIHRINTEFKNLKSNDIDKYIYDIQEELISKKQKKCYVCGSRFETSTILYDSIEILRQARAKEEQTYNRELLGLENLKKNYNNLLEEINSSSTILETELNKLGVKVMSNTQKYEELLIKIDKSKLDLDKGVVREQLEKSRVKEKEYNKIDKIIDDIIKTEDKLSVVTANTLYVKQKVKGILAEIMTDYINIICKFNIDKNITEMSNINDENKVLKIDNILKNISLEIDELSEKYEKDIYCLEVDFINNKKKVQKLRSEILLIESKKNIYLELLSKYNTKTYSELILKFDEMKLTINSKIDNIREKISLVKSHISSRNLEGIEKTIREIKKNYEDINIKIEKLEIEKHDIVEKLVVLEDLLNNLPNITSELTGEFLKISNKEINRKFKQISPYITNKQVNIISREGGLYILLTESDKYEELVEMSKKEFGKQVNASMTLSSAQSNILALSVFLTSNKINEIKNFGLIGLDDPFQNMDDINIYSLIDILCDLIDHKQVLISTHDHSFVNLLISKSNLRYDEVEIVEYITYDEDGVYLVGDDLGI